MSKFTYGFLVETTNDHSSTYVQARVVCRKDDSSHPINCQSHGESALWDAPKRLDGFMLDGLQLRGFVSDVGGNNFVTFEPTFYSAYSVTLSDAKAMVRTLTKINKQIQADESREAGDIYMSIATALRLTFYTVKRSPNSNTNAFGYDKDYWYFNPIGWGRDAFRDQIKDVLKKAA